MQAAPYGGKQSTPICFITDYYYHLCIISALVSCGWWAAPAGARLFFFAVFSAAAGPTHGRTRRLRMVLGGLAEFERELIRARTGEELSLLAWETPETQSE